MEAVIVPGLPAGLWTWERPPDWWLTNARITHYQSVLLDKDRITFGPPTAINPATLLPEEHGEEVIHQCQDILAEEAGVRSDLKDTPLPDSDVIWYMDGSSFLHEGNRQVIGSDNGPAFVVQPEGDRAPHQYQVGDFVYVCRHQHQTLEPRWKGPYQILLTTPTAVKVDGITTWIHASHLKPASAPDDHHWTVEWTDNPLKLRIRRWDPGNTF
ncbi:hypothetical protein STEG23_022906 [Scotinomys teguina]